MRFPDVTASTCPNDAADWADHQTCAYSIRLSAQNARPDGSANVAPEGKTHRGDLPKKRCRNFLPTVKEIVFKVFCPQTCSWTLLPVLGCQVSSCLICWNQMQNP